MSRPGLNVPTAPRHLARTLGALLLLCSQAIQAFGPVPVALEPDNAAHQSLLEAARDTLADDGIRLQPLDQADPSSLPAPADGTPVVTIGSRAAANIRQTIGSMVPVLHVLLPELSYHQLDRYDRATRPPGMTSGIFLDQPLPRRLRLLELALPERRRLGVLLGPGSYAAEAPRLWALTEPWRLHLEEVRSEADVGRALRSLLEQADVLLAMPDPVVFNANTIQEILLPTYRRRIPVLGFSKNYVKAGALLAVYSTPEQIGRQLARMLLDLRDTGATRLPPPRHPEEFEVTVNRQVARSLDLALPGEAALREALRAHTTRGSTP